MSKVISQGKYVLAVVSSAEKKAGGRPPSPEHIASAQADVANLAKKKGLVVKGGTSSLDKLFDRAKQEAASARASKIAGYCQGERVSNSGSFWSKIKNAASTVVSNPVVRSAFPYAAVAAPLAAASPFVYKAIQAQREKGAREARERQARGAQMKDEENSVQPVLTSDESEAATAAGGAEIGAAARQRSPFYFPAFISVGSAIPHELYRAAVVQHAQKFSGGRRPSTKDVFRAERLVKGGLAKAGLRVAIPGARPGRRTV